MACYSDPVNEMSQILDSTDKEECLVEETSDEECVSTPPLNQSAQKKRRTALLHTCTLRDGKCTNQICSASVQDPNGGNSALCYQRRQLRQLRTIRPSSMSTIYRSVTRDAMNESVVVYGQKVSNMLSTDMAVLMLLRSAPIGHTPAMIRTDVYRARAAPTLPCPSTPPLNQADLAKRIKKAADPPSTPAKSSPRTIRPTQVPSSPPASVWGPRPVQLNLAPRPAPFALSSENDHVCTSGAMTHPCQKPECNKLAIASRPVPALSPFDLGPPRQRRVKQRVCRCLETGDMCPACVRKTGTKIHPQPLIQSDAPSIPSNLVFKTWSSNFPHDGIVHMSLKFTDLHGTNDFAYALVEAADEASKIYDQLSSEIVIFADRVAPHHNDINHTQVISWLTSQRKPYECFGLPFNAIAYILTVASPPLSQTSKPQTPTPQRSSNLPEWMNGMPDEYFDINPNYYVVAEEHGGGLSD